MKNKQNDMEKSVFTAMEGRRPNDEKVKNR